MQLLIDQFIIATDKGSHAYFFFNKIAYIWLFCDISSVSVEPNWSETGLNGLQSTLFSSEVICDGPASVSAVQSDASAPMNIGLSSAALYSLHDGLSYFTFIESFLGFSSNF